MTGEFPPPEQWPFNTRLLRCWTALQAHRQLHHDGAIQRAGGSAGVLQVTRRTGGACTRAAWARLRHGRAGARRHARGAGSADGGCGAAGQDALRGRWRLAMVVGGHGGAAGRSCSVACAAAVSASIAHTLTRTRASSLVVCSEVELESSI